MIGSLWKTRSSRLVLIVAVSIPDGTYLALHAEGLNWHCLKDLLERLA